jgi:hypothetical protein
MERVIGCPQAFDAVLIDELFCGGNALALQLFLARRFASRTPGPPPFSSMNSTERYSTLLRWPKNFTA